MSKTTIRSAARADRLGSRAVIRVVEIGVTRYGVAKMTMKR